MDIKEVLNSERDKFKKFKNKRFIKLFIISFFVFFCSIYLLDFFSSEFNVFLKESVREKMLFILFFSSSVSFLIVSILDSDSDKKYIDHLDNELKNLDFAYSDVLRYEIERNDEFITEDEMSSVLDAYIEKNKFKELSEVIYLGTDPDEIEKSKNKKQEIEKMYRDNTKRVKLPDLLYSYLDV